MTHNQPTTRLPEDGHEDINVLTLKRGDREFRFVFRDDQLDEVCQSIASLAANPDVPFSWYEAALLSRRVRDRETNPTEREEA